MVSIKNTSRLRLELSDSVVNIEMFRNFEDLMNVQIPHKFYTFIKNHDAAYISPNTFLYFDNDFESYVGGTIGRFLSFNSSSYNSIKILNTDPPEFFPKGLIAFAEDGGGNLICFDYREGKNNISPPVVFWSHEADIGNDVSFVANNFEEFINNLKSEEEIEENLKQLNDSKS